MANSSFAIWPSLSPYFVSGHEHFLKLKHEVRYKTLSLCFDHRLLRDTWTRLELDCVYVTWLGNVEQSTGEPITLCWARGWLGLFFAACCVPAAQTCPKSCTVAGGAQKKNLLPACSCFPAFAVCTRALLIRGWAGSGEVVFAFLGEAVCDSIPGMPWECLWKKFCEVGVNKRLLSFLVSKPLTSYLKTPALNCHLPKAFFACRIVPE